MIVLQTWILRILIIIFMIMFKPNAAITDSIYLPMLLDYNLDIFTAFTASKNGQDHEYWNIQLFFNSISLHFLLHCKICETLY